MARENAERSSGICVPNPSLAVVRACHGDRARRIECRNDNVPVVAGQLALELSLETSQILATTELSAAVTTRVPGRVEHQAGDPGRMSKRATTRPDGSATIVARSRATNATRLPLALATVLEASGGTPSMLA